MQSASCPSFTFSASAPGLADEWFEDVHMNQDVGMDGHHNNHDDQHEHDTFFQDEQPSVQDDDANVSSNTHQMVVHVKLAGGRNFVASPSDYQGDDDVTALYRTQTRMRATSHPPVHTSPFVECVDDDVDGNKSQASGSASGSSSNATTTTSNSEHCYHNKNSMQQPPHPPPPSPATIPPSLLNHCRSNGATIVYGDTDSMMVTGQQTLCKELQDVLNMAYEACREDGSSAAPYEATQRMPISALVQLSMMYDKMPEWMFSDSLRNQVAGSASAVLKERELAELAHDGTALMRPLILDAYKKKLEREAAMIQQFQQQKQEPERSMPIPIPAAGAGRVRPPRRVRAPAGLGLVQQATTNKPF